MASGSRSSSSTTDSPDEGGFLRENLPYPALLALGVLFAWLTHPLGTGAGIFAATCAFSLVVGALERFTPLNPRWGVRRADLQADLLHAALSNGVPARLLELGLKASLLGLAARLADRGLDLWPDRWPFVAQVFLALFAAEVGFYTVHRFFHESGQAWAWRLHAVHHSLERMYFLAGTRTHPLQVFLSFGATVVILWAMGVPTEVLYAKTAFHTANGILQHCNLDLRGGLWNWVLAGPEPHRWHHSRDPSESNHNYGNNLILLDVLFGTRWVPKGSGDIPLGLPPETRFTNSWLGHLAMPFAPGERPSTDAPP